MAKRRSNAGPLIVTTVLVAAVLGGGLWFINRSGSASPAAQADAQPPALPTGPLKLLSPNVDDVQFLAANQVTKTGDKLQVVVLDAGKTATSIGRKYAFEAKRETVDCKARQIGDEVAGYYDGEGKLVTHELQSGALGRAAGRTDPEVAAACGMTSEHFRTVPGWKAAQREIQAPPADLVARAQAAPKDTELWAWVCADGARGHWNPSLPKWCDKAVALNPTSTATLVDRAYLKLATKGGAAAKPDFAKAISMDSQNPEALFGHSLAGAMSGDRAGGKAERDKARAIDPKVMDWIERTYHFDISEPYRSN